MKKYSYYLFIYLFIFENGKLPHHARAAAAAKIVFYIRTKHFFIIL